MIEIFQKLILTGELSDMIDEESQWNSLLVDYDNPVVERLWTPWAGYRIYLHRIHPCHEALLHPHPWPSAVWILDGEYEMGVGHGPGDQDPPMAARIILQPGSMYEMLDIDDWHYVKPLETTYTVMVSGAPWHREHIKKADYKMKPLDDSIKQGMLEAFKELVRT